MKWWSIVLIGVIVFSVVTLLLFFRGQDTIYFYEKEIKHTQEGVPYHALIYNGEELTDHRYIIGEDLCVAENLGMEISIYPCNTKVFIGTDIENYVDFTWTGGVAQDTSWVFVYEGTLESGEMSLGRDEVQQYTIYEMQERWIDDYMVSGVTSYVDISPPTIESCELGTENNSMMYHVSQENETAFYETNYCFSELSQINSTAFLISGNASLSTAVQRERTITIYDTPIAVEYLGQDLLGNGFQYYQVLDVTFQPGQTYKTKWSFTPQDHALSGKWHIFGFNADYSLEESLDLGQYIYVDPSWTSNFNLGLVAYYMMNDTTGNGTDAVFADNNITVFNQTVNRGAWGILNSSYQFGGLEGDWADVMDITTFNSTIGTIAFWYNWTSADATNQYAFLISDPTAEHDEMYITFNALGGTQKLTAWITGGWRIDVDLGNVTKHHWQHIAVVQNGTGVTLYLNGTIIGTDNGDRWIADVMNIGATILRLGAQTWTVEDGRFNWKGSLDEMAIWNRTLTDSEVSDLYNAGAGFFYDPDAGFPTAENITIALDYPTDNSQISSQIINFTATLTPIDINNTNATLYLWNSTGLVGSNITNLVTGAVANQTNFSIGFNSTGFHTWNVWGCGNSSNNTNYCYFAPNNFSFTILSLFTLDSHIPTHSFETKTETFIENVSLLSGLSITNADLIWNGTNKGGSYTLLSPQNYSLSQTFDIPVGTNGSQIGSYWNVTFDDGGYSTTNITNMSVDAINFTLCSATPPTTAFINFTFKDEVTNDFMGAKVDSSTWYYYLGGGAENISYTFQNTTAPNPSYGFCAYPPDHTMYTNLISFKYSNASYPQRTYEPGTLTLTNSTTNTILYLLSSADGIYSSIQALEVTGTPISGVDITLERQIVGVWITIGTGVTGDDGLITFWVNPNYEHRITGIKSGYVTAQVVITPSQTLYSLILTKTETTTFTGSLEGMSWTTSPPSGYLAPGTYYFSFNLTANLVNLDGGFCKLEIVNTSDTIVASVAGGNSSFCAIGVNYAHLPGERIFGKLYVDTTNSTGYILIDSDIRWSDIEGTDISTWTTVWHFFTELKDLDEWGEGHRAEWNRVVLFFIFMTIFIGLFSYFTQWDSQYPGAAIVLVFAAIIFASFSGWFINELNPLITKGLQKLDKYVIAYISFLLTLGWYVGHLRRNT